MSFRERGSMHLFDLPAPAYRTLLELLACDTAFCNSIVPVFRTTHCGGLRILSAVGLYLCDAPPQQARGK